MFQLTDVNMLLEGHCRPCVQVIVWSTDSQVVSTFRHALPVIALAFSSFADQLASATSAEYALWSPGDSPVVRQKVRAPKAIVMRGPSS